MNDSVPLTLYGSRGSGSAAVEMGLQACGLPYAVVRASTWEADSAQTALVAVNPLGQIPTLVLADGTVISESASILIHLGLMHPDSGLLPPEPARRAMVLRGLVFIAANCYSAISIIDYPERWTACTAPQSRDDLRFGTRSQLHRHWELFSDTFAATPFLGGNAPGALDFLAAVVSRWSGTRAHLAVKRPQFHAMLQDIDIHPRAALVTGQHWPH